MRGGQGVGCAEGARRDAQEGPAEPSPRRERCWRRGFGNRSWGLQCKIESSVLPALRAPWPLLRITRRLLWFDPLTAKSVCVCVCLFVGMPKAAEWRWEVLAPNGCGSTAPEPFWFKYDETPEWRWEVLSPGGCGGTAPYLLWSKYDETPEWRWEILSPEGCG